MPSFAVQFNQGGSVVLVNYNQQIRPGGGGIQILALYQGACSVVLVNYNYN